MITLRDDLPLPDGFTGTLGDDREAYVLVSEGGRPVGVAVARVDVAAVRVSRVWTTPDAGPVEDEIVAALRDHFTGTGVTVVNVDVAADQIALARSVQSAPVLGIFMTKPVDPAPPTLPERFGHRAMTDAEFATWSQVQTARYADDILERSGGDREAAERDARASYEQLLPDGSRTADTALFLLTHDGEPAGHLWVRHHWSTGEPGAADDLSFVFDVEIDERFRGRGLGRAAMALGERLALAAGDAWYGLHVFGFNDVARRLYVSYGFEARSTSYDIARRP